MVLPTSEGLSGEGPPPRVVPRAEHTVSRQRIDPNALKVLYRLDRSGYEACLVGGGVRDLMLGRSPKDFDVVTDARPEEVRRLFRNSRIIGRRFRLVHVFFRESTIEVSTFRTVPDPEEQGEAPDDLLVLSDNVFGSPREDAFRRDFTINALLYRIRDFSIVDYVGGCEDLEGRLIRVIGDPDVRFREDPVRMLRACELAGRLGFGIEESAQEAIWRHRGDVEKAAPARLVEELIQILRCGFASDALQWMYELGLTDIVLPEYQAMIDAEHEGLGAFGGLLPVLDGMVRDGRELTDGTLLASLAAPRVLLERHRMEMSRGRLLSRAAIRDLVHRVVESLSARLALSKLRSRQTLGTLQVFQRLCEPLPGGWAYREVTRQGFFDDAMELFEIMVDATGEGEEHLEAWRLAAQSAEDVPPAARSRRRGRRRRRRRRRRSA